MFSKAGRNFFITTECLALRVTLSHSAVELTKSQNSQMFTNSEAPGE